MGWSAAFIARLHEPNYRPRFLLETVEATEFLPGTQSLALSSHYMPGYVQGLSGGSRIGASRLEIGDWSASISEMTINFRGTIEIRRSITRGQLLVLRVGWPGWPASDYEPVFHGHVVALDRAGDEWSITMRSVVASLTSRMTQVIDDCALFSGVEDGEIAAEYEAGDPQVVVLSTAAAEADQGGSYLLQLFPDDGDPFFLVSDTVDPPFTFEDVAATACLGTTAATSSGRVVFCAHINRGPVDAARRILVSTGGTNGPYDTLPMSWGIGIPDSMLDHDDIGVTLDLVETGLPAWRIYATEPQDDGLSWVQSVLSPAGIIVTERQGLVTIRAVSPADVRVYADFGISDADIISFDRQEAWDSGNPLEFAYFALTEPSGATLDDGSLVPTVVVGETLETRPASGARTVHLAYLDADETDWCNAVAARLAPWSTRPAELVALTCRGLRLAYLAPCDSITINSRHFSTRDGSTSPRLMVLSAEPDWWGGTVRLVAAYHPPTEEEF
jgi:hypothetical protein